MTALQDVRDQLAAIKPPGAFATRRTSPAGDLRLEVKGVGPITLPIGDATARRLAATACRARYGLKDQTRFDTRVRDSWEIPKGRIVIEGRTWGNTLRPMLDRIRRDLGLADGSRLRAELHNLLVYGPGQFFVTHQDSEKTDDMIGTLIVILPSASTGGTIEIEHHDERVTHRGSGRTLTFIAFYADCHHRVRPVKAGHRVVLTYNLMVDGEASTAASPASAVQIDELARSIKHHFETPRLPRWSHDSRREPPDRLVYLLDYQYTRRSLDWNRLKGADGGRAATLRQVATHLDCEIFLALADVHETWSYEDEGDMYGDYGRRREWGWQHDDDAGAYDEEDADMDADTSDTTDLIELLDSDIELRHWIATGGRLEAISGAVDSDEVCCTKASKDLEPFASEHEGYMGNYGNTVDRWYHRAAIVLWPRERTFVIRAKVSPRWAIDEIRNVLRQGEIEDARRLAERLTSFWIDVAHREESRGFFERVLGVAVGLDSPDVAPALLKPFALERLTPRAAPKLVAVSQRYGFTWCQTILESWTSNKRGDPEGRQAAWTASLPAVCLSVCAGGSKEGVELARWLVANRWAAIVKQWGDARDQPNPNVILDAACRLSRPLLGLLESSLIADHSDRHGEILRHVMSPDTEYPTRGLVHLLRTAHETRSGRALRGVVLAGLHEHCVQALTTRVHHPARQRGDWSIAPARGCRCHLCGTLSKFLGASDQVQFEWPLAKDQRRHIHRIIDSHDLPVSHITRRVGRPFTLVLTKTDTLFERDAAERELWGRDVRWLTRTARAF